MSALAQHHAAPVCLRLNEAVQVVSLDGNDFERQQYFDPHNPLASFCPEEYAPNESGPDHFAIGTAFDKDFRRSKRIDALPHSHVALPSPYGKQHKLTSLASECGKQPQRSRVDSGEAAGTGPGSQRNLYASSSSEFRESACASAATSAEPAVSLHRRTVNGFPSKNAKTICPSLRLTTDDLNSAVSMARGA